MKLSLSTNWCNLRLERGEDIANVAKELGFEELELGFHTTDTQAAQIVKCDILPVGSVHAFCPVPISAPQGYPELYQLASFDEETRAMARFQVKKNVTFAASVGADTLVLHAGRVLCDTIFPWSDRQKKRVRRGEKMLDIFKRELETLVPELERNHVTLGLENLPYLEGFPDEREIAQMTGDYVRFWFDTGHDFVRRTNGWNKLAISEMPKPVGAHINDSNGGDDHLPPGKGKINFAALSPLLKEARHLVFEPNADVTADELRSGINVFRQELSELPQLDQKRPK